MNALIDRRSFLLGAAGVGLVGCAADATAPAAGTARMPEGLAITHVGAPDCPWCRMWYADARGPWLASPESARVTLLERNVPMFRVIAMESAWPADVRWLHDEMRQRGLRIAAPTFTLSEGQTFIAGGAGLQAWNNVILPAVRARLAMTA